mmetsp:Transcript_8174/g.15857  ORF Transcript_8174/g.15857 Transcript_8174/m.15857 type:complete len:259 (-) Transcript_8174:314-1090(-)
MEPRHFSRPMHMSEEERIARMEVEMHKHLRRAGQLRQEIVRAKQALMQARRNNHLMPNTDPTAYRRLDARNTVPQFATMLRADKTPSPQQGFAVPAQMAQWSRQGQWQHNGNRQQMNGQQPMMVQATSVTPHVNGGFLQQPRVTGLLETKQGMNPGMMQLGMAFQQSIQQKQMKKAKNTCPYCQKVFQNNSRLERHIRSHTGERPFSCTLCGDRFKQKCHLTVHMKRHHFKCPICSQQFSQKEALIEHVATHTDKKAD